MEIVFKGKETIYAWESSGENVSGNWPISFDNNDELLSLVVGDIDGIGNPEIILASKDQKLYAFHSDGSTMFGFPIPHIGNVWSTPALGDIDNDGKTEIIVTGGVGYNNIYVWDTEGDPAKIQWAMFHHDAWHTGVYGFKIPPPTISMTFGENESDDINNVTHDTYIRTGNRQQNFNFGSEARIRIGNKRVNDLNRSLIKFDFISGLEDAGVTSPDDIFSAALELSVDYTGNFQNIDADIYRLKKDWGEGFHKFITASAGEANWNWAKYQISSWSELWLDNSNSTRRSGG